jgi:hypothetical protein
MDEDSSFFQTVYKEPFLYRRAIHPLFFLFIKLTFDSNLGIILQTDGRTL